jgi:D-alanine-D-alanine ligase
LTPIKVFFPEGETFKHYDLKWLTFNGMKWRPVACPSVDRLCREAATKAFVAILGGIGYGRSDFRVDADGKVWFLEINPNCGLFYPDEDGSADFVLQFDPLIDHALFAQGMIQAAILRQAVDVSVSQPCYRLGFNVLQGHFLVSTRPIQSGELVFADEGAPFNLVSTEHVRKFWAASGDQRTLAQYGWPISDDVMIIWSQNHKEWRPINHSCDPNLWFGEGHSFNVYARRDIACEEHLTMDYSTFCCDPLFESFECGCGASCCRGHVEGSDYAQLNSLQACFGTRVTAYVYKTKTKRSDLR